MSGRAMASSFIGPTYLKTRLRAAWIIWFEIFSGRKSNGGAVHIGGRCSSPSMASLFNSLPVSCEKNVLGFHLS